MTSEIIEKTWKACPGQYYILRYEEYHRNNCLGHFKMSKSDYMHSNVPEYPDYPKETNLWDGNVTIEIISGEWGTVAPNDNNDRIGI